MSDKQDEKPSHVELERINDALLQRVASAKAAYQEMRIAVANLKDIRDSSGATHPDGTQALLNALRMERVLTQKYTDVIKALTEFTLNQKLPADSGPWSMRELHPAGTGHSKCRCGEHLVFGNEPSAYASLVNPRQNDTGKTGECPRCGCVHEIPHPPE